MIEGWIPACAGMTERELELQKGTGNDKWNDGIATSLRSSQ